MAGWLTGEVVELKRWTQRLYSLRVEAPVDDFKAGQFNRLGVTIDGERVARPYSYVNAPDERPLDFYFITVPEGSLTNRLQELGPGDTVELMSRANGFFVMDEIPDADVLWMFATGTALGPYLSILKTEAPWQRFDKVVLVHAVRTAEELTYQETIQGFRDRGSQFQFVPFVSREEVRGALPGRVPAAIENGLLERHTGLPLTPDVSQVMICGNPDMVADTSAVLKARGMTRNRRREPGHITTENYW
ncbi:ferredoxin-NADP reductase [Ectothiorhodospira haloalkaliphila]|uniref:ferredoxin--NADP(+) reductase n=1 Tax=Ectothiorhodospira haloalkaliphila TaxID=421628 RepID=W8KKX6_9GAMM|nr:MULTISPECIES: ferredoxin--NADP reductase [Ectothiorhodospira]AHK80464.1 ferredoxin-NADP reductase [Ectothiorhodospira haloalkaliphila]MCG5494308.1 ferredoxin--NADP reductase [Ectothiorhodospira variabilis]MCG5496473.1 ferredoxin--NADP reductase [Ectothiorhodospira variabilis]MCG5504075.1 ferredoxin--NADP reductase [Ectothiorhodospira variabilis]MCG5507230.1 ferredoxin--NADP reductase [Ectothiorhodospira variabilis]